MGILDFIKKATTEFASPSQKLLQSRQVPTLPIYTQQQGVPMQLNRHPEDASYIPGQQGYVPINADVAHFPMQPQGLPEDAGLVMGPQGYHPMNADISHPMGQMQPFGQMPEDSYTPAQYAQPVNYNNGQVSLNGGFIQGAFAGSRQNPYRRVKNR